MLNLNKKIKNVCLVLLLSLLVSPIASAEMFKLKSGKEIEGKIIEKTKDFIKIDTGTIVVKIRLSFLAEESLNKLKSKSKYSEFLQNKGLLREEDYDKDSIASWTGWHMTTQYYINQVERNYYEMHRITQRLWRKLTQAIKRKDRRTVGKLLDQYREDIDSLIESFEKVRPSPELKRYHSKVVEYQKFIKKIPNTVLLMDKQSFLITHKRAIRALLEAQEELDFLFRKYGAPEEELEKISETIDMLEKVIQLM